MHLTLRHIILSALILLTINLRAQNLTGTWEGDLGNDQFLQLNILQTGNKICGYTRDHIKKDSTSFCKAFFEGYYDKKIGKLIIEGKYFLQTSGDHFLMKLQLDYIKFRRVQILEQIPARYKAPTLNENYGQRSYNDFRTDNYYQSEEEEKDTIWYVSLKKVSNQPNEITELMKDCIARDKKQTDSAFKINPPPMKKDSLPPVVKITIPQKPTDSLPPVVIKPPVKKDSIALPKTITQRKNIEQSRIEVNVKTINLKVYDNAIVDGDTVSILYNGKMLLTHQLLSEKGIELNIELDENKTRHEIILFAENLGSIPPNTALVVITAGAKRYELFASASLEENAVLVFEYKPVK